jgi:hypothetical protein
MLRPVESFSNVESPYGSDEIHFSQVQIRAFLYRNLTGFIATALILLRVKYQENKLNKYIVRDVSLDSESVKTMSVGPRLEIKVL